ncbi:C-C chemokine receptor-like 2 isoform X1 [Saccopteryx leptura]|uniref:C-C chemokine receptor-like 2 isoform X1 n=2 Tax=Saccopteryx leptura TaxID=249018 RepID=UPI00339D15D8
MGSPPMAAYTLAPDEDDYDVLIEGDLNISETEQCHQYDAKVLWAALGPQFYTAVSLVGLLDNILVMFILVKFKRLRQVEHIYFLNLAVSNWCFSLALLLWVLTASDGGTLGHPMCTVLMTLSSVGLHGEVLFSALLTLQSYLVSFQARRFSSATRKVPCGIIASVLAWVIAILVTLPEFLLHKSQMDSHRYKCFLGSPHTLPGQEAFWKRFLTLKANIVGLLVPLLVLTVCCGRMRRTLRSREKQHDLPKLAFAIMVVFLLMWAPYNIALFLATFKNSFALHDCRSIYNLDRSVQVTRIVASTHCCVNLLLCVLLDQEFRKRLCCLCRLCADTPLRPAEDPARDTPQEEHDLSTKL